MTRHQLAQLVTSLEIFMADHCESEDEIERVADLLDQVRFEIRNA